MLQSWIFHLAGKGKRNRREVYQGRRDFYVIHVTETESMVSQPIKFQWGEVIKDPYSTSFHRTQPSRVCRTQQSRSQVQDRTSSITPSISHLEQGHQRFHRNLHWTKVGEEGGNLIQLYLLVQLHMLPSQSCTSNTSWISRYSKWTAHQCQSIKIIITQLNSTLLTLPVSSSVHSPAPRTLLQYRHHRYRARHQGHSFLMWTISNIFKSPLIVRNCLQGQRGARTY